MGNGNQLCSGCLWVTCMTVISKRYGLPYRRDKPQSRDRDRKSKIAHGRHSTDTAKEDHDRPLSDAADKQRHRHNDAHGTDRHEKKRHSDSTPSDRNDHSRQSRSRDVSNAIDSTSMLIKDEEDRHHAQRHAAARKPVVNPNSKQAELLASVASEMNTFNNDGSFMEQFAAKQAGPPGGGTQGGASPKATAADGAELALSGLLLFSLKCTDSRA